MTDNPFRFIRTAEGYVIPEPRVVPEQVKAPAKPKAKKVETTDE